MAMATVAHADAVSSSSFKLATFVFLIWNTIIYERNTIILYVLEMEAQGLD